MRGESLTEIVEFLFFEEWASRAATPRPKFGGSHTPRCRSGQRRHPSRLNWQVARKWCRLRVLSGGRVLLIPIQPWERARFYPRRTSGRALREFFVGSKYDHGHPAAPSVVCSFQN